MDGTVHLKNSTVVTPVGSATSTTFKRSVSCDNSAINGGFYLSDVVDADTSNSFTVTYKNGDQVVTKLVVGLGQKAIAVSLPTDGKLYIWYNGDVAYDFDELVNENLELTAKWYVTAETADNLKNDLDNTKSELNATKSELGETQNEVTQAQSKIDELNAKLSSVTAWMIVWIVLSGLSGGASVTLFILFKRKK